MATQEKMLEELRKIREAVEPKPASPPPPPPKGLLKEFIDFLSKYKVMGLAVAFIMGVYLGSLVQSLVKDLILPIIGLAVPGLGNLATYTITVPPETGQVFGIGNFLVALITFIIVAFVIFLIVKISKKWGIE